MYAGFVAGTVKSNVHYLEVNLPLWTDGSHKQRWVILKAGTSFGFREKDDYWDCPDGAVFFKEFTIDTAWGDLLADTSLKASIRTWPAGLGKPSRMKK